MASEVVRDGIKRNTFLAGSMTELSGKNGILFCVLAGVMLTGISLAQDSTRGQESESENNPVLTALLHTRGSGLSPTSQPKDVSDQQARTQAILAEALKARTPVHVSLVKSVDARKNKPSAELIATTRQEIRSADGEVVVPVGAAIVGLIREVTLRSPDGQEANIEIAVDHVLLTNGSKTSILASCPSGERNVTSLIRPTIAAPTGTTTSPSADLISCLVVAISSALGLFLRASTDFTSETCTGVRAFSASARIAWVRACWSETSLGCDVGDRPEPRVCRRAVRTGLFSDSLSCPRVESCAREIPVSMTPARTQKRIPFFPDSSVIEPAKNVLRF